MRKFALPIVIFLLAVIEYQCARACETDEMRRGCRISEGQCSCGFGCKSEFRYEDMGSCKLALRGERHNACFHSSRCLHDGICIQISSKPGYRCSCAGTRFFGVHCDKPCPKVVDPQDPLQDVCVVI
ncbi:uncharacterized protein LOC106638228 [Copidosoma floridanum]|uniref:uncharacterized protein LOC106638228 n=1 Tax=Copidosoma floridanum TaxID=29053 RepID=UPI0006C9D3E4|nr:uncharacterized protein LOC106638228 [Copidosoma floridanum]